ncbi:MAG TPA: hypothetical protein VHL11_19105, partial [Phototrophicaceae bacterium]|nr:hypothetical protein [Phototrophicaceae bacterium]
DGVNGLKINQERGIVEWYDSLGCACGDSSEVQTYSDFLKRGPNFPGLPDDVKAEIEASLIALGASAS